MIIRSYWSGNDPAYARMADVLWYSLEVTNPRANVAVIHSDSRETRRGPAFVTKAIDWTRAICDAPDGAELVLLDTDMLVIGDLSSAFDREFDIAVTTRGRLRTINSGALFVRVSDRVRAFFAPWADQTRKWCAKNRSRVLYGDQDALRHMISNRRDAGLAIVQLPMRQYNATQYVWRYIGPLTKVVHVKSDARETLFYGGSLKNPGAKTVVRMWREWEARMIEARGIEVPL